MNPFLTPINPLQSIQNGTQPINALNISTASLTDNAPVRSINGVLTNGLIKAESEINFAGIMNMTGAANILSQQCQISIVVIMWLQLNLSIH